MTLMIDDVNYHTLDLIIVIVIGLIVIVAIDINYAKVSYFDCVDAMKKMKMNRTKKIVFIFIVIIIPKWNIIVVIIA